MDDGAHRARTRVLAILFVLAAAAALRLPGLSWGLPQVYEEGTPLKQAWEMWGWGPVASFDLNPHFFRYPSLALYLQLLVEAILWVGLRIAGSISSTLDFRFLYHTDPTAFYLAGRAVTALFGIASVALCYLVGTAIGGRIGGWFSALLLAVNVFHIERSQAVEVDVPLTCFVLLALWAAVRIGQRPTQRAALAGGVAVGLAASIKYTGLFAAVPILVAHLVGARERKPGARRVRANLLLAAGAAALAFAATSPFVLLDWRHALADLRSERVHMAVGHFGGGGSASWVFYSRALVDRLLGWPLVALAAGGLIYFAILRRRRWALVLGSFVLAYGLAVGSWTMRADRYLLPLLPVAILFAGASVAAAAGRFRAGLRGNAGTARPRGAEVNGTARKLAGASQPEVAPSIGIARTVGVALLFAVAAAPQALRFPEHLVRLRPDTRTLAKVWIEEHVPAGSFLVSEAWGPDFLDPLDLVAVEPELRERLRQAGRLYAFHQIPLLQVYPELTGPFYDLHLYAAADYVITTSTVRDRYQRKPEEYPRQAAFYRTLDLRFEKAATFEPDRRPGPTVIVYRNPLYSQPFAERKPIIPPRDLEGLGSHLSGEEVFHFFSLGLNYETFGFVEEALTAYELGLQYPSPRSVIRHDLVVSAVRCLVALGRPEEAFAVVDGAIDSFSEPAYRSELEGLRKNLSGRWSRPHPR